MDRLAPEPLWCPLLAVRMQPQPRSLLWSRLRGRTPLSLRARLHYAQEAKYFLKWDKLDDKIPNFQCIATTEVFSCPNRMFIRVYGALLVIEGGYNHFGTQAEGASSWHMLPWPARQGIGKMRNHVPKLGTYTLKWHIIFSYTFGAEASHVAASDFKGRRTRKESDANDSPNLPQSPNIQLASFPISTYTLKGEG